MAISDKDCTLLFYSKSKGVSFENTITLGRLKLNVTDSHFRYCLDKYKNELTKGRELEHASGYSEPLFEALGATETLSIDNSDYEGASIIHDMNFPVSQQFHSRFTLVVDGGTMEHIFNFPVAIKNCMEMLKVGGHFIGISPTNNQMGHGFYQFSPELYYRVFSKQNGFQVKKMFITTTDDSDGGWYEVADPVVVKGRVMLRNEYPLSLIVIAQRISDEKIFKITPQQSDYQTTWEISSAIKNNLAPSSEGKVKFFYRKYFPRWLKTVMHFFYNTLIIRKEDSKELGAYDSRHFKKVEL